MSETEHTTPPLIFLELNELNFDMIQQYVDLGYLPNFKLLLENYALNHTIADLSNEYLQPWIQWVSIHSGKPYNDHQIFKQGDITQNNDIKQHWETLEEQSFSVAAFAPNNAANRSKNAPFWLPHPAIDTEVSGESWLYNLYTAMKQLENSEQTQPHLSTKSKTTLAHILLTKTQKTQWPSYLTNAYKSLFKQCHWANALILDRLLTDAFIQQWRKYNPNFATLYLNAGAYFQQHYWFNSKAYAGSNQNPFWYIKEDSDPLLDIYQMYDQIIADIQKQSARLIIATGLSQIPNSQVTYHYRLEDKENLLANLGLEFKNTSAHQDDGFYIECQSQAAAQKAERTLRQLFSENDEPLFDFTNQKEKQVFAQLTYPHEIKSPFPVKNAKGETIFEDFSTQVRFIKIVNSHKHKIGYYLDTALNKDQTQSTPIPVEQLYDQVMDHFDQA